MIKTKARMKMIFSIALFHRKRDKKLFPKMCQSLIEWIEIIEHVVSNASDEIVEKLYLYCALNYRN